MEETKEVPKDTRLIHVMVVGGGPADIYEIGQAMRKLKNILPYRLEAIVTNDNVTLRDADSLIQELYKLKKMIDREKELYYGKQQSS